MVRIAAALAILLLAGCTAADFNRPGRVPSYRQPFVSAPANSEYQPPNSLPP